MSRITNNLGKKSGYGPGTTIYTGSKKDSKVSINVIDYTQEKLQEKTVSKPEECLAFKKTPSATWINVNGLHDTKLIEKLGECFGLHPLTLEDIAHPSQRPKIEEFDNYLFLVLRMMRYEESTKEIETEQVSIVLGNNYVISFQEKEGDVFDGVRERIRGGKSKIRKMGSDYLAYALIDAVVDNYFNVLEKLGEDTEELEEKVVQNPEPHILSKVYKLKHDLIYLRKSVWPLREVLSSLQRSESKLIKKQTMVYFRDVYDHTIQVIDTVETLREMASGMLDVYLSSVSNKMNEVMKVLTVIATIFIPLTFLAGVYGMNFKFMPELSHPLGYPVLWLFMITVGVTMLLYFKRRGWV
ncbi:MAG: magnesium/cobalt transporter CorA [Candidatus Micrarchaeota archaeon]